MDQVKEKSDVLMEKANEKLVEEQQHYEQVMSEHEYIQRQF